MNHHLQYPSPLVARKLFKLLLRASRPLAHKNHIELLSETVAIFKSDLLKLSHGEQLLTNIVHNPLAALRESFRHGNKDDIQILMNIIPHLLRFFRAAKLIHQDDLFRVPRKLHQLGSLRSPYNMGAAGLLSSKLFTYERDMKGIHFERMHRDYLEKSIAYVRRTINRAILDRRREAWALGVNLSVDDLRRMRVYYMFLSLDRLFWLWDLNQLDFIDRIFPTFSKVRIDPKHRYIGDLSFYANIVNNMLEYELEAYGAVINNNLYMKVAPKPQTMISSSAYMDSPSLATSLPLHPGATTAAPPRFPESSAIASTGSTIEYASETESSSGSSQYTSDGKVNPFLISSAIAAQKAAHGRRRLREEQQQSGTVLGVQQSQTVYTHRLSALQLQGQHFFTDRCHEVVFVYHPESYILEAVMHLDPNKMLFSQSPNSTPEYGRWRIPKDHVIWRIDLSQFHDDDEASAANLASSSSTMESKHGKKLHPTRRGKSSTLMLSADDRKHWLYLDREYQGVEIPVPPEFYNLPVSSDGRYHPTPHESGENGQNIEKENTEGSDVFGAHGVVPSVCYVKFRRPPSTQRIEDCLLPHVRSSSTSQQPTTSLSSTNTGTSNASHTTPEHQAVDEGEGEMSIDDELYDADMDTSPFNVRPKRNKKQQHRVTSPKSWHSIRQQVKASSSSSSSNSNMMDTNTVNVINASAPIPYRSVQMTTNVFYSPPFYSEEDIDIDNDSENATKDNAREGERIKTVETLYHGLPSYVEAEVRFCRRKEEKHNMSFPSNQVSISSADDAESNQVSAEESNMKVIGEMQMVDEETGLTVSVVAMEVAVAGKDSRSSNDSEDEEEEDQYETDSVDTVGSNASSIETLSDGAVIHDSKGDFKDFHANLNAQARERHNFQRLEPYTFETVRYAHILDLDGAYIQVTNDGLRPVFHSELFPAEQPFTSTDDTPTFLEKSHEPLVHEPPSSLNSHFHQHKSHDDKSIQVVEKVHPITSAGLMIHISKIMSETFYKLGFTRPGFSILGNAKQDDFIYNGTSVSSSGFMSSNLPTDPLRQRYGHSIGGSRTGMGKKLAWEAAYWNALHNYFARRQKQVEEQYLLKLQKKQQREEKKDK